MYDDTADGHFFIGRDPERPNLFVAAGGLICDPYNSDEIGSGHSFKFGPGSFFFFFDQKILDQRIF
jgi:hypothetical protein